MKITREKLTVIISLLLLTFCAFALATTANVSRQMSQIADEAIALTQKEPSDGLDVKIDEIERCWEKYKPVISTYSRHDEVERVSSAVQKLRPLRQSGKNDEVFLTLHELSDALEHLRSTELPTIANIL